MTDRRNEKAGPESDERRPRSAPQLDWGPGEGDRDPGAPPREGTAAEAGGGTEEVLSSQPPGAPGEDLPPEPAPSMPPGGGDARETDTAVVRSEPRAVDEPSAGADGGGSVDRAGAEVADEPAAPPPLDEGASAGSRVADEPSASPEAPAVEAPAPTASRGAGEGASVNVLEVRGMDWRAVRRAVTQPIAGERAERILERMEERLAGGGPLGLAFEEYAAGPDDRAIQVGDRWPLSEVWFIGDLHGDLLAL